MKRYTCPRECGNNVLGPERMRKDDVRRYCLPCSEATGRMVERVCPARERANARKAEARREKARAERERAAQAERRKWTLKDGTDVRKLVKKAKRLRAWAYEGEAVARAVKRCQVDVVVGEPGGSHGMAWTGRVHVHLRRDVHPGVAMSIIIHELAHVAHAALVRSRGIRRKRGQRRKSHGRMFWSLWMAGMVEAYPSLKDQQQAMYAARDAASEENRALNREHDTRDFTAYDHYQLEWANRDRIRAAHDLEN